MFGVQTSGGGNTTYAKIFIGRKGQAAPAIKVRKKDGDQFVEESYPNVEGTLDDVYIEEFEYEGRKKKKLVFMLSGDQTVKLESNFSKTMCYVLNGLMGSITFPAPTVLFQPYEDDNGYRKVMVRVDGQRTEWKFNKEDLPESKEMMVNGDKVYDHTEFFAFFEKQVDELRKLLKGDSLPKEEVAAKKAEPANSDDLPF